MPRRAPLLLLLALACLGAGPVRCGDDPTPALEAKREALLRDTVPKTEFWEAVGRKGELLKQEKALQAEVETLEAAVAAAEAETAAVEAELAAARDERLRAEAALEEARAERGRALEEKARRERRLEGFASRLAADDAS